MVKLLINFDAEEVNKNGLHSDEEDNIDALDEPDGIYSMEAARLADDHVLTIEKLNPISRLKNIPVNFPEVDTDIIPEIEHEIIQVIAIPTVISN